MFHYLWSYFRDLDVAKLFPNCSAKATEIFYLEEMDVSNNVIRRSTLSAML